MDQYSRSERRTVPDSVMNEEEASDPRYHLVKLFPEGKHGQYMWVLPENLKLYEPGVCMHVCSPAGPIFTSSAVVSDCRGCSSSRLAPFEKRKFRCRNHSSE